MYYHEDFVFVMVENPHFELKSGLIIMFVFYANKIYLDTQCILLQNL